MRLTLAVCRGLPAVTAASDAVPISKCPRKGNQETRLSRRASEQLQATTKSGEAPAGRTDACVPMQETPSFGVTRSNVVFFWCGSLQYPRPRMALARVVLPSRRPPTHPGTHPPNLCGQTALSGQPNSPDTTTPPPPCWRPPARWAGERRSWTGYTYTLSLTQPSSVLRALRLAAAPLLKPSCPLGAWWEALAEASALARPSSVLRALRLHSRSCARDSSRVSRFCNEKNAMKIIPSPCRFSNP